MPSLKKLAIYSISISAYRSTMKINVRYYDGKQNIAHPAVLLKQQDGISIHYANQHKYYPLSQLSYIAPIGKIAASIDLEDDARIEFSEDQSIPEWLQPKHRRLGDLAHRIEGRWRWILLSFVMSIAVIFAGFKWGIPFAAEQVAYHLPEDSMHSLGDQAQAYIFRLSTKSTLSPARQQQIRALYQQKIKGQTTAHIFFRHGGENLGANALAIPNGSIILTDELVNLTQNDHELLGVIAHEQGHLDQRHSLQQSLRGIGIGLIYILITGDVSDAFSGLPLAMAAANYSQSFELQADQYAVQTLKQQHISPKYLADFLQRLSQSSDDEQASSNIFASHPPTKKRIAQILAETN
jgi:Zn-dependent protease with chaperone function